MEKALRQQTSNLIKICVFGPESSGKSTLSRKLAQHYEAALVPEFAREYLQELWDTQQKVCRPKDLLTIAYGQIALENKAVATAKEMVICDTDLLTTKVYSEAYYNEWSPPLLSEYAVKNTYDLYLLTYIDTPWVADDLRDRPEQREAMFYRFKKALDQYKKPYILCSGTLESRFKQAKAKIDNIRREINS